MADSMVTSQKISTDIEFSGALNKAIAHDQNKNFGLLLAMLQQNVLDRSLFVKDPEPEHYKEDINQLNHYRSPDLLVEEHHWQQQQRLSQCISDDDMLNAKLWSCFFPSPLSLYNDKNRIDDEVKANASYETQQKLDLLLHEPSESDPTKLYDILNSLSEA